MSDLPSSANGVMQLLPNSKEQIDMFSRQLINSVENGEVNALELKAMFKAMEQVIEKVDKATKESQLRAAEKWAEKKFNAYGAEIEKAEVGVFYDYSNCNDPEYTEAVHDLEEAKAKVEARATFLKSLKDSMTIVVEGTGEVAKVNPPVKKSSSGLKFSFK